MKEFLKSIVELPILKLVLFESDGIEVLKVLRRDKTKKHFVKYFVKKLRSDSKSFLKIAKYPLGASTLSIAGDDKLWPGEDVTSATGMANI